MNSTFKGIRRLLLLGLVAGFSAPSGAAEDDATVPPPAVPVKHKAKKAKTPDVIILNNDDLPKRHRNYSALPDSVPAPVAPGSPVIAPPAKNIPQTPNTPASPGTPAAAAAPAQGSAPAVVPQQPGAVNSANELTRDVYAPTPATSSDGTSK